MSSGRRTKSGRAQTGQQSGSSQNRGGIITAAAWQQRFPHTAYADLPEMPIGKGQVSLILELLDRVAVESVPAALCIAGFLAEHRGKYTGHAMHRRTQILSTSFASPAALASARQYAAISAQMGSDEAEPSARLGIVEIQVLSYFHGSRISWTRLVDQLTRLVVEFQQIADTGKREGSTHALLAYTFLRQAQGQPNTAAGTSQRDVLFKKAADEFCRAITLLGMAYDLPDIVDTVRQTASHIVEQVLSGSGTHAPGQKVTASA